MNASEQCHCCASRTFIYHLWINLATFSSFSIVDFEDVYAGLNETNFKEMQWL